MEGGNWVGFQFRRVKVETLQGFGIARFTGFEQGFGLFAVVLEIQADYFGMGWHEICPSSA
jgi:hypothetical protein